MWTVLYRRKYKNGQLEDIQKKRTRYVICIKFGEAISHASLAEIMGQRSQKSGVRKVQRLRAIRTAKEMKESKQEEDSNDCCQGRYLDRK